MQKKPGHETATREKSRTTSRATVQKALARATPELAADEEKALRMLNGVSVQRTLVLERVGQEHPDSREKLLGIELELLRQWREKREAGRDPSRAQAKAAKVETVEKAPANPRRTRIADALKKKPTR